MILLWKLICKVITCGSRVHVKRKHFIPKSGANIFCCNHPTSFDPCYVYGLTDNAAILMTQFVFDLPVAGSLMNGCGFIPVRVRESQGPAKRAYPIALNELMKGRSILLAPEGKMSPDNSAHKAHIGAARLSYETGRPIVPMGIRHEGKVIEFQIKDQTVRFMPVGKTFINMGAPLFMRDANFERNTEELMGYIHFLAAQ